MASTSSGTPAAATRALIDVVARRYLPDAVTACVYSGEEAVAAARQAGYPVAMKVVSEDISHKSDVGGVQLNLRNDEAVRAAFERGARPKLV